MTHVIRTHVQDNERSEVGLGFAITQQSATQGSIVRLLVFDEMVNYGRINMVLIHNSEGGMEYVKYKRND